MQGQYNMTTGTKPLYTIKELEAHPLKEVHSPRTQKEIEAMSTTIFNKYEKDVERITNFLNDAKLKKDSVLVNSYKRELRQLKSVKRRNLRMFEYTSYKGHSNIFDEVTMAEQNLFLKAPEFHVSANEIDPTSKPEGYIGLAKNEFVVSKTEAPIFNEGS